MRKTLVVVTAVFLLFAAIAIALFFLLKAPGGPKVSVILDFFANPNHVPLYVAAEKGFFTAEGIEVEILIPADPSDPLKLAAARTTEVALSPQINFLIARDAGLPLLAIGALIETPLGGLLSMKEYGIDELSDLRGHRIGYSLAPLEPILWRTMLGSVGVGAEEFELINVGFNTVSALLSHHVDAIGAFRNFELIQVGLLGREPIFFPQEDYNVPDTYEIILAVNPQLIAERHSELRALMAGLQRGIAYTKENPQEAIEIFFEANPDLDDALNRHAYTATVPLYADGARHDDEDKWERMQEYLFQSGLIDVKFPLGKLYTDEFLKDIEGR
ncbi:MAG: ABC transporter substrate-binding protein [Candidatus Bipolaricaulota bacterium]|nr:ABC transporter substrate-binding protein [Candidatus Bipolaricaulota bacterium]